MPHVAFVPFVGFRVHRPELRELGLSLPGLRRRGEAIAALPALGLLTLAGWTPEAWGRSWHEAGGGTDSARVLEAVARERPTLVAVSALTASIEEAYAFTRQARAAGLRVVLGGLHVTACPDEAVAVADAVVVGEGEPVWERVLRDAERGALQPRYQTERPFPLGASRLPDWDLLGPQARPRFTLQTQRGCPWACEFCAASRLLGPFREKPLACVEAELAALAAREARPRIELADDNTFAGARDPAPLFAALAGVGARWFTEADWRLGERPDVLAGLADSGCAQVLVGVESLAPRWRGLGGKAAPLERVEQALVAVQDAGVPVNACFVVGADGETRGSVEALRDYLLAAPFAEVQVTLQTPFPGTALRRRLAEAGRLLPGRGWAEHTLFDLTYRPDAMGVDELEAAFHDLVGAVFAREATARRDRLRRRVLARRRGAEAL